MGGIKNVKFGNNWGVSFNSSAILKHQNTAACKIQSLSVTRIENICYPCIIWKLFSKCQLPIMLWNSNILWWNFRLIDIRFRSIKSKKKCISTNILHYECVTFLTFSSLYAILYLSTLLHALFKKTSKITSI